ncbi:MAG: hypothetical protein NWE96_07895 [Candidatus Bathyarchaeota archaeon]|nr:hypothetical protein [Candidatus Bathyarchaeota archaeon]
MPRTLSFNFNSKKKTLLYELLIIGFLIAVGVVVLVWQAPAISSFFQSSNGSDSQYTTLSLVPGTSQTYQHNGDSYVFSYRMSPSDESGLFYVAKNLEQTRSFPAVVGAVYSDLGLEIKVSTVTQDLMVVLVKPLPK